MTIQTLIVALLRKGTQRICMHTIERSNTDYFENIDSEYNLRHSSRTRNPLIRFGKAYTH